MLFPGFFNGIFTIRNGLYHGDDDFAILSRNKLKLGLCLVLKLDFGARDFFMLFDTSGDPSVFFGNLLGFLPEFVLNKTEALRAEAGADHSEKSDSGDTECD